MDRVPGGASVRLWLCTFAFMLMLPATTWSSGQSADCTRCASLSGRVLDPQGRVVSNAVVTLGDAARGVTRGANTDLGGEFAITNLPPGCYTLAVNAPTFAAFVQPDIVLKDGEARTQMIRVRLETVAETVTVDAKQEIYQDRLDVAEVRESSAKDLGEALQQVDSVWKVRKGGIANDVVVRGFQQNNVNFLINGTRMYGACPGKMDPPAQHVDFAEVERVDIVKGAFDVRNQGTLGAVVNVVTKEPSLGLRVKPTFSTGSFGFYNPAITASYGTEAVRVLGGYSYRVSDPTKTAPDTVSRTMSRTTQPDCSSGRSTFTPLGSRRNSHRPITINSPWHTRASRPA